MIHLLFHISIRQYQRLVFFALFCLSIITTGCSDDPTGSSGDDWTIKSYSYEVTNSFPHDPAAFTQGLVFENDTLYEGTGRYGLSDIRKVILESGQVVFSRDLDGQYFGEGITIFGENLYQLTWRSKIGFVYNADNFALTDQYSYNTEGWGLTHNDTELIMSDGSSTIYFRDPVSFAIKRIISVRDKEGSVSSLNELEYIDDIIYANVWLTDKIVMIDPTDGKIIGVIDLTGILAPEERSGNEDVLNGIAWDRPGQRLFVTGKLWPKLYEIELILQ